MGKLLPRKRCYSKKLNLFNLFKVYVIDSSDQYRLEESGYELRNLLEVNFFIYIK